MKNTNPKRVLNLAAIQTGSLALGSARLDYFLTQAKARGCRVAVLGEYVCNLFFKELEKMPLSFVREQGEHHYENLKKSALHYNMTLIAPLVTVQNKQIYKALYRFTPGRVYRSDQQILMDYPHWNEERFFANETAALQMPPIFSEQGFKVALLSGYELHFDLLWHKLIERRVDLVIVPTASTFESFARWQTLLKSRSFTGGCYLLRVNRIGDYEEGAHRWEFYGNSLLCNPFGEIENALDDREGLLIASLDKREVGEARRAFGFARALKKREF
ncbi:MAG: carbon-nitrogen hydrolase family protein [Campylobacterales bacterium]